jgi:hypothetical protein
VLRVPKINSIIGGLAYGFEVISLFILVRGKTKKQIHGDFGHGGKNVNFIVS